MIKGKVSIDLRNNQTQESNLQVKQLCRATGRHSYLRVSSYGESCVLCTLS